MLYWMVPWDCFGKPFPTRPCNQESDSKQSHSNHPRPQNNQYLRDCYRCQQQDYSHVILFKTKKRKKRTLTNSFLVVQNMFSVLEGMDMGMIILTVHDWKKTNAVIGWRLQPPTKRLCCKFNCTSAQRSYQNSRDHRRTGTEKSNEPPHMTSWQLVRLK